MGNFDRRAHARAWYAKNKEKVLGKQAAYYQKNKKAICATVRAYNQKNSTIITKRFKDKCKQYPEKQAAHINRCRRYYLKNKKKILAKQKLYWAVAGPELNRRAALAIQENPIKRAAAIARSKAYYEKNKVEQLGKQKLYWAKHGKEQTQKHRERKKISQNKYTSFQWRNNMTYRLRHILRERIRSALKGARKSNRTLGLVGCTIEQLKIYLASQFQPEMNWSNYGSYWHIDHKLPCASFNLADPAQQAKCFHYTNLQPLEAMENIRKSNKILPQFINI